MMRKKVITYGTIIGVILCINMIIMVNMIYSTPDFKGNDILGYAFLILVFTLVFFGIRAYRNKDLNGFISFWQAFRTGLLITLVASTIYVVVWLFYYYLFVPDFIDVYTDHVLRQCTTEAEIAAKTKQMTEFKEMYQKPLFVVLITFMEVFPIGLVVSLISSFILKKKKADE